MRVLVVDNNVLAAMLQCNFQLDEVDVSEVPRKALWGRLQSTSYHVVLINFKHIELLADIRKVHSGFCVVVLEQPSDEELGAFLAGADDCIDSNASYRILLERIKRFDRCSPQVQRSVASKPSKGFIVEAGITLDEEKHTCTVGDTQVVFTRTQYDLLAMLMRRPENVFSRRQLLDAVRGEPSDERVIDSHFKRIRKKLEDADPTATYIQSIYGLGYKFEKIKKPT